MKKLTFTLSLFALAASFLLSPSAFADTITLALDNSVQTGTAGSVVDFTATVSAPLTNGAILYLNSDSYNVDAPLTVDDTGFFTVFPYAVNPGDNDSSTLLFAVDIPNGTAAGIYNGYFEVLGGSDGNTFDLLSTSTFQVDVASSSPVPEPSSILLLATGLLAMAILIRNRSRSFGTSPIAD